MSRRSRSGRRTCPVCKAAAVRTLSRPKGLWEKWVSAPLGLKPFRCGACRARFLAFGGGETPPPRKRPAREAAPPERAAPPGKAAPGFDELIREMRETERRLLGTPRPAPPDDPRHFELKRRERTLMRAETAGDDVVDGEILDVRPGEGE